MDRARARPVSLTIRAPLGLALAVCAGFLLAAATGDLREMPLRSLRWTDPAARLEAIERAIDRVDRTQRWQSTVLLMMVILAALLAGIFSFLLLGLADF